MLCSICWMVAKQLDRFVSNSICGSFACLPHQLMRTMRAFLWQPMRLSLSSLVTCRISALPTIGSNWTNYSELFAASQILRSTGNKSNQSGCSKQKFSTMRFMRPATHNSTQVTRMISSTRHPLKAKFAQAWKGALKNSGRKLMSACKGANSTLLRYKCYANNSLILWKPTRMSSRTRKALKRDRPPNSYSMRKQASNNVTKQKEC